MITADIDLVKSLEPRPEPAKASLQPSIEAASARSRSKAAGTEGAGRKLRKHKRRPLSFYGINSIPVPQQKEKRQRNMSFDEITSRVEQGILHRHKPTLQIVSKVIAKIIMQEMQGQSNPEQMGSYLDHGLYKKPHAQTTGGEHIRGKKGRGDPKITASTGAAESH